MRILQINVSVNKGSTGRIAEQIGETIMQKGDESLIAYGREGLSSNSKTIKIGNNIDVYKHVLYTRLFDKHGYASKKVTKNLINKIKNIKPDIIHLHNIHGYYVNIEVLFNYLNEKNTPIVWTLHDCWTFTGHCSYFDRVDCQKWKTECYSCPMTKYYPTSWFIDNSKNNFKRKKALFTLHKNITIVTPSKWLKQLVKQSYFNKYPIRIIHNGIDLSVFKPIQLKKDNHEQSLKKVILGVASIWDSRKGLDDFIKLNDLLEINFQIVLVGLSKIQIDNLPSNIIGIERTENTEELVKLYASSDVYINPTYSDNFPTTNIEALACGTPVITYDTGGSPEAIDINTGIVVPKGDIDGLNTAIETIINCDEKYTPNLCRVRAVKNFNKDDRFMDYFNLYKELLEDQNRETSL